MRDSQFLAEVDREAERRGLSPGELLSELLVMMRNQRQNVAWIGVDLDGTLAKHYWPEQGPYEPTRIGEPIPAMVARVKGMLASGMCVKIFTARVGPQPDPEIARRSDIAVRDWCLEVFGRELEVTATKDYCMVSLWDDRAVRVHTDTGEPCCEAYCQ